MVVFMAVLSQMSVTFDTATERGYDIVLIMFISVSFSVNTVRLPGESLVVPDGINVLLEVSCMVILLGDIGSIRSFACMVMVLLAGCSIACSIEGGVVSV